MNGVLVTIAVAVTPDGCRVAGHAGQTPDWLVYVCRPGKPLPPPQRVSLTQEQLPHHFRDDAPHPLHGVSLFVAGSAGDGYVRHMRAWGAEVILTGESDPAAALERLLTGAALPAPRFDVTTTLCRLRDLFSRH